MVRFIDFSEALLSAIKRQNFFPPLFPKRFLKRHFNRLNRSVTFNALFEIRPRHLSPPFMTYAHFFLCKQNKKQARSLRAFRAPSCLAKLHGCDGLERLGIRIGRSAAEHPCCFKGGRKAASF